MNVPESLLLAIVTAILGGIGFGFRVLFARITNAADACERDRKELWDTTNKLGSKIRTLEDLLSDCPAPDCPIRPKPLSISPVPRQLPCFRAAAHDLPPPSAA